MEQAPDNDFGIEDLVSAPMGTQLVQEVPMMDDDKVSSNEICFLTQAVDPIDEMSVYHSIY